MSIPTSIIVVFLVVAWLAVLVPMIARRRERVPQAEAAGSTFRVLRRASASLRRRPGRGAKGLTVTEAKRAADTSPDAPSAEGDDKSVAVGAEPVDAAEEWAAAHAEQAGRRTAPQADLTEPIDDADDDSGIHAAEEPGGSAGAVDGFTDDVARAQARPSIPDEVSEQEWADHVAAAPVGSTSHEVDDLQLRPIPRRPGRGGFDPEAAEATRAYRYQQRRRITLILAVAMVVFTVAALLLVSWLWAGAAISLALLVGYLTYLRRQVRIEAAIRQRRMERLQRARQIRPEYARPPRRTRGGLSAVEPGRTVVDLDDDDPAFDELEEFHQAQTYRRAAGQ